VNYPALTGKASWFVEVCIQTSPQALLPAVPAVDFIRGESLFIFSFTEGGFSARIIKAKGNKYT